MIREGRCPHCSQSIPLDAPCGLCPECLFNSPATRARGTALPESIGDYPIRSTLGQGGFGVVYLAHQPILSRDVALKIIKHEFANEDEVERFRQEVGLLAQLDLPNVVRIYDAGVHEGHPYFTMPVMAGGTLRERLGEFHHPRRAATLMATIARAVHALHTHPLRVLHRDLKPENILFDLQGNPYISDFGIAKVATADRWTHGSRGLGSPSYVAPEQAFLDQGDLTPAADVYSLGAIFYELLTKVPPHAGGTVAEVLRRVALEEPVAPQKLRPGLDRDMETVCLHALKRVNVRYSSAAELADDLENAIAHRPVAARRSSIADRSVHFVRRHPWSTSILLGAAVLALLVLVLTRTLLKAREQRLQDAARTNAFTASGQAGSALFQLADYASRVQKAARDPTIIELVHNDGTLDAEPAELKPYVHGFDSLLLLDVDGHPRAHWRQRPADYVKRSFAFRDYFQKARHLAEHCPAQAYLARAFRSEEDGKIKFALSAPLLTSAGEWLGVFLATIQADSAFGEVQLQDPEGGHLTALLGPRDRDRHDAAPAPDFTFLVHDGLMDRVEHVLHDPSPAALRSAFGALEDPCEQFKLRRIPPVTLVNYRDPVPGFSGRWLAAIAPVGQTGFVVLVQTRHPEDTEGMGELATPPLSLEQ